MTKLKPIVIPRQVKIHVSRKDIDTGLTGNASSCAIAKAVKVKLGDHPSVDPWDGIEIDLACGVSAIYDLPKAAIDFIRDFDDCVSRQDRKELKPFTFTATLASASY